MKRGEAALLADKYILQIWGVCRTAWINGFINYPQRGIARYPKTSITAAFRKKGANDIKIHMRPRS